MTLLHFSIRFFVSPRCLTSTDLHHGGTLELDADARSRRVVLRRHFSYNVANVRLGTICPVEIFFGQRIPKEPFYHKRANVI